MSVGPGGDLDHDHSFAGDHDAGAGDGGYDDNVIMVMVMIHFQFLGAGDSQVLFWIHICSKSYRLSILLIVKCGFTNTNTALPQAPLLALDVTRQFGVLIHLKSF